MVGIAVVTRAALLIARRASTWTVDEHLAGLSPECVAVDLRSPAQVYCGTARDGLFRSRDSGRNWEPIGPGIAPPMITAVDVGHAEQADGFGVVYAGTEPSAVFRSDNGGDSWVDLTGLRVLPSANTVCRTRSPSSRPARLSFIALSSIAYLRSFNVPYGNAIRAFSHDQGSCARKMSVLFALYIPPQNTRAELIDGHSEIGPGTPVFCYSV